MIKQPEDFDTSNFEVCDTHGGSAYRDWTMLFKHKGVFIGFRNHDWCVFASSNPEAQWSRGCQDSTAHGSALPQSKNAKLVSITTLPEPIQKLALKWVDEAIEIARDLIKKNEKVKEEYRILEKKKLEEEYQRTVIEPWNKVLAKESKS